MNEKGLCLIFRKFIKSMTECATWKLFKRFNNEGLACQGPNAT